MFPLNPHTGILIICRSRYVPFIEEVVGRFDHYCDWVHNAIGAGNHRAYLVRPTSRESVLSA